MIFFPKFEVGERAGPEAQNEEGTGSAHLAETSSGLQVMDLESLIELLTDRRTGNLHWQEHQ